MNNSLSRSMCSECKLVVPRITKSTIEGRALSYRASVRWNQFQVERDNLYFEDYA